LFALVVLGSVIAVGADVFQLPPTSPKFRHALAYASSYSGCSLGTSVSGRTVFETYIFVADVVGSHAAP
tara:strand:+ start:1887 stop:2093 length:207 start_codon:yes stop_codon:yes gene_type:complete